MAASEEISVKVNWEFDAKDNNVTKFGNFSSPTIIKLVSKYNKGKKPEEKADAEKICVIIVEYLNSKLNS